MSEDESIISKIRRAVFGAKRNIEDPSIFQKLSLIPILAWIGLGADGLSSSSYGPAEAFNALGNHTYLAVFLALGTAITVFVISYAYSRIIEHFPSGGGGYVVATRTLGNRAGVFSGGALLVDYMLTITVSIAACSDALFSFLPFEFHSYKLIFAIFLIISLIVVNLRGVKESVTLLAPIFIIFIVSHGVLLGYGILSRAVNIMPVVSGFQRDLGRDAVSIGIIGILAIFFRAYALGGGTYTGIEAVANGLPILREPRVQNGKRTMAYMAASLAFVAGGFFLCYLLWQVNPVTGRTLNAVLADRVFSDFTFGGWLALITILSEGALLIVGAQTGFIDGPRVMANMAKDCWVPRRFASLSERLVMNQGILLMGGSALLLLIYTNGSVSALVVLYAINVFITFSLSELGMVRFFVKNRQQEWKKHIAIHSAGLVLCSTILIITLFEKFNEGGWLTLLITCSLIGICYLIRGHYQKVASGMEKLNDILKSIPAAVKIKTDPVNSKKKTAVQLVTEFNGFGVRSFITIIKNFPDLYENFIFVSVAVVDSGSFKGIAEIHRLKDSVRTSLQKYVDLARSQGIAADFRTDLGTDVVETAVALCRSVAKEFPDSTFFAGQIVFRRENPFQKILHNETAFAIQRRLQYSGITTVILPIQAEE